MNRRQFIAALTLSTGLVSVLPSLATAQSNEAAEAFIKQTGDEVIAALKDGSAKGANASGWFSDMLGRTMDIETMGRFTLGRFWRSASPAQRSEFLDAFRDNLVAVYSRRLQEYSGEDFQIISSRPQSKDTLVTTRITSPTGQAIDADWRVRDQGDGSYRVIDFVVGNVSLLASQRSEYASVIQRNGGSIDALIQAIRAKTAEAG
ncbi:MAG: ABC transporter substrate-binding protein [Alphaproteobacteria bacterium]|nr:ABC transporter substrate-binding protein [Alphaproteobacteria bacterium SS10]